MDACLLALRLHFQPFLCPERAGEPVETTSNNEGPLAALTHTSELVNRLTLTLAGLPGLVTALPRCVWLVELAHVLLA